jgi:hypothetical protein
MTTSRELAHRNQDGLQVTLFWDSATDAVWVAVLDQRQERAFEFFVDGSRALDAFYHPYVYAPASDVELSEVPTVVS